MSQPIHPDFGPGHLGIESEKDNAAERIADILANISPGDLPGILQCLIWKGASDKLVGGIEGMISKHGNGLTGSGFGGYGSMGRPSGAFR